MTLLDHGSSVPAVSRFRLLDWPPGTPFRALPDALLPKRRVVRDTSQFPEILGRIGTLELRLARTAQDIRRAQRLRYQVFYAEGSAAASPVTRLIRRDKDVFDRFCDHLLVIDTAFRRTPASRPRPRVVGTYRLLLQQRAEQGPGFYSAREFDFRGLLAAHPAAPALELGRSCVLGPYRTRRTVELLWRGIWQYVKHHRIGLMFGCASLEGSDPQTLGRQLAFLHHTARTPDSWAIAALPGHYVPMNRLPPGEYDLRQTLASLPPLIKAYLRIGGKFGNGATHDRDFGTTDVFVALRVADIEPRYIAYYGDAGDAASRAESPSR